MGPPFQYPYSHVGNLSSVEDDAKDAPLPHHSHRASCILHRCQGRTWATLNARGWGWGRTTPQQMGINYRIHCDLYWFMAIQESSQNDIWNDIWNGYLVGGLDNPWTKWRFLWAMASMAMLNNQSNLVGGLEHEWIIFPYTGNNYPNWRTHIFQRGRYTTNQI